MADVKQQRVFINYSRKDSDFAQHVRDFLESRSFNIWMDTTNLLPAVDWQAEILRGVEESDVFLHLHSPDSARSEWCHRELGHALSLNKRVIVIALSSVNKADAPEKFTAVATDLSISTINSNLDAIASINWISAESDADFERVTRELLIALNDTEADRQQRRATLHDVYIEYSRTNLEQARRIHTFLEEANFRVWMDEVDLLPGVNWREEINTALENSGAVVLMLSPAALRSPIIHNNLSLARRMDKPIYPVLIEAVEPNSDIFGSVTDTQKLREMADNWKYVQTINWAQFDAHPFEQEMWNALVLRLAKDYREYMVHAHLTMRERDWRESNSKEEKLLTRAELEILETPIRILPIFYAVEKHQNYVEASHKSSGRGGIFGRLLGGSRQQQVSEIIRLAGDDELNPGWSMPERASGASRSKNQFPRRKVQGIPPLPNFDLLSDWDESAAPALTHEKTGLEIEGWIGRIVWDCTGDAIYAATSQNRVRCWLVDRDQTFDLHTNHQAEVYAVAVSPDGTEIVSGDDAGTILISNLEDRTRGSVGREFGRHRRRIEYLDWSPDGRYLAAASADGTVGVWDGRGIRIETLPHPAWVNCAVWSPDGKTIAVACEDTNVYLWNAETYEQTQTLTGHTAWILTVKWSHEGRWLASASNDGTIRVWEIDAIGTQLVKVIQAHRGGVRDLDFSFDDQWLASRGKDGTFKVWYTSHWKEAAAAQEPTRIDIQGTPGLAFHSHDTGVLAAVGRNDRAVRQWSLNVTTIERQVFDTLRLKHRTEIAINGFMRAVREGASTDTVTAQYLDHVRGLLEYHHSMIETVTVEDRLVLIRRLNAEESTLRDAVELDAPRISDGNYLELIEQMRREPPDSLHALVNEAGVQGGSLARDEAIRWYERRAEEYAGKRSDEYMERAQAFKNRRWYMSAFTELELVLKLPYLSLEKRNDVNTFYEELLPNLVRIPGWKERELESAIASETQSPTPTALYLALRVESSRWQAYQPHLIILRMSASPFSGGNEITLPENTRELMLTLHGDGISLGADASFTLPVDHPFERTIPDCFGAWVGRQRVSLDVYANGTLIDTLEQPISIYVEPRAPKTFVPLPPPAAAADPMAQQADLTLRLYADPLDADGHMVRITVIAYSDFTYLDLRGRSLGYRDVPLVLIDAMQDQLRRAVESGGSRAAVLEIGRLIWREILPADMRKLYANIQPNAKENFGVRSILVIVDEHPFIPVELAVPRERPLCEEFVITRWVEGLGQARKSSFPLGAVSVTVDANIAAALPRYHGLRWSDEGGELDPRPVFDGATEGAYGFHTTRAEGALTGRAVQLSTRFSGEDLDEILRQQREIIGAKTPLIGISSLSDPAQPAWVDRQDGVRFIKAGAAVVIGSWWSVSPAEDRLFWETCYAALENGDSVGDAVSMARRALRAAGSAADLAYFVIGDPAAQGYRLVDGGGYLEVRSDADAELAIGKMYTFTAVLRRQPPAQYSGARRRLKAWTVPPVALMVDAPRCTITRAPERIHFDAHSVTWTFTLTPNERGRTLLYLEVRDSNGAEFVPLQRLEVQITPGEPVITPVETRPSSIVVDLTDKSSVFHVNSRAYPYGTKRPTARDLTRLYEDVLDAIRASGGAAMGTTIYEMVSRLMADDWWNALSPQTAITLMDTAYTLPWELAHDGSAYWGVKFCLGHGRPDCQPAQTHYRLKTLTVLSDQMLEPDNDTLHMIRRTLPSLTVMDGRDHLPPTSFEMSDLPLLVDIQKRSRATMLHLIGSGNQFTVHITDRHTITLDPALMPADMRVRLRGAPLVILSGIDIGESCDLLPAAELLLKIGAGSVITPLSTLPRPLVEHMMGTLYDQIAAADPHTSISAVVMRVRERVMAHAPQHAALALIVMGSPDVIMEP